MSGKRRYRTAKKNLIGRPERRFWFRLALALGLSVGQAQSEIDAREFAEWQAYYTLEPFGEERADYRNAILCTLIANALRGKHGRQAKPKDFMPDFTVETKPQTPSDMRSLMNIYTQLHNRKHG